MTAEPTGLFQGLEPLLVNRTVIMTVAADGKGLLTLNVIPKKVKDDESDALTTALCITASAEELDRELAAQLREFGCAREGCDEHPEGQRRTGSRRESRTRSCRRATREEDER